MSGSILDITSDKIAKDVVDMLCNEGLIDLSEYGDPVDEEVILEKNVRDLVYKNLEGFGLEVKYGNEIED